jgi:hypothetical protein
MGQPHENLGNEMKAEEVCKKPIKKSYKVPKLENLGSIVQVTQKSGATPDSQQVTKPGGGQG